MTDTFDYLTMRDIADALIAQFGQAVLIRRVANTGSGWEPTQTATDYPTLGVVGILPRWYPSFVDGDVLRTDRIGYASAGPLTVLGIEPTPFDRFVTAAGQVFRIIDSKPINPAGTAVIYVLQLRI